MRFNESRNPFMKQASSVKKAQPVLDSDFIQREEANTQVMTIDGAVNKSYILGGIMLMTALFGFMYASPLYMYGGAIGGLVLVLVAVWKPHLSGTIAPLYAAVEGLFVGAVSAMYASLFNGIVFQAITLTLAILFVMLTIHKTGLIPVTDKFRRGVVMATAGIFFVYILSWILGFFGINVPFLHEGGMIGIGISLAIIGVASLNLLLDFDNFEKGEKLGMPKYMEWFFAMGLLITLVWLYVEILRLLAIFAGDE